MKTQLAPIVIFVYRREIGRLIKTLKSDPLAAQSDLIVFSDGPRDDSDAEDVTRVRASLQNIDGFKSIRVVSSTHNKGLAASIIDGVTEVIDQYGKIIVLEDDLVVSKDFLQYMNDALAYFENDARVWSVSGYGANLPDLGQYTHDIYLAPRANSWGWATWKDRWDKTDWEVLGFDALRQDKQLQTAFNRGGNDLYRMLDLQMNGRIDSWAIRWSYSQFKYGMYTVFPVVSKVANEGFADGRGAHNNDTAALKWHVDLRTKSSVVFEPVEVNAVVLEAFKKYYDLGPVTAVGYFLKKHGGYSIVKKCMRLLRRWR